MFATDLAGKLLPTLTALIVYREVGGKIPIAGLSVHSIALVFLAILVQFVVELLVYSGYFGYVLWSLKVELHTPTQPAIRFFFLAFALPALANPFGILTAGLYAQEGLWVFLYGISGFLLVAVLARLLSQTAEYSRQQSRQLEQLEKLGRSIINAPPDASTLPEVLKEHVLTMFASRGIVIWTETLGSIMREPMALSIDTDIVWKWLKDQYETRFFLPGEKLPWEVKPSNRGPVIVCPIKDVESGKPMGGIYLELQPIGIPWDAGSVLRQAPAVQSISAQVASAIHQAHVYAETLAMQKTMQELSLARTIQASFLPETIPQMPGWQLTAILEPARQMAGDFYDFIPLPGNKLGILIADVADKGLGAALYMALSCTLIRTFADDYANDPATVLTTANQHILRNARANLFVTVFYGVLDPATGLLNYANAGHTPPYLLGGDTGIQVLRNTGMPLGIDEENTWGQETVQMDPGDMLMLYTDGVTDAQNNDGEFIDRKMILDVAQQYLGKSVQVVQQVILEKVHRFVGGAPRFDDITLVILGRENGIN
jgi:serine phosphatase RsbU (regulator of sigma subunit)